jgi:hypothetical protein
LTLKPSKALARTLRAKRRTLVATVEMRLGDGTTLTRRVSLRR